MYDVFEQLAHDSSIAVCVLGNSDVSDIELVGCHAEPLPKEILDDFARRGLGFVGLVGLVDGRAKTALAVPLDAVRIEALSRAFCTYCETLFSAAIDRQRTAPAIQWLKDLFELEDDRTVAQ